MYAAALILATLLTADEPQRVAHWREDLNALVTAYSAKGTSVDLQRGISTKGQKDFDKVYPHFYADREALNADIPKLSDGEIVLRLMKMVASANIAHNMVQIPSANSYWPNIPLGFYWFSDGLGITAASTGYEAAQGAHVLRIGDKTPEQVLAGIAHYIPHENDQYLRESSTGLLRSFLVLEQAGVTNPDGQVTFTLQKDNEPAFTLKVQPAGSGINLTLAKDALQIPPTLAESHPRKYYWHQYLEDSATLFIQYNACANDSHLKFSDFAAQVLADADSHPVKRVVIDLRRNGGGDSRIIRPLESGLESRLKKLGPVYVLIGPRTFSSGTDNARQLRSSLHATLIGEPTGGKPDSYGEVKYVTLPNSKLVARFTSKWFGSKSETEPEALAPDILTPRTLAHALAAHDPAVEAALNH